MDIRSKMYMRQDGRKSRKNDLRSKEICLMKKWLYCSFLERIVTKLDGVKTVLWKYKCIDYKTNRVHN